MTGANDGLGPDFSGIRAHAHLEIHMRECSERQAELRAGLQSIHGRLDAMQESFDDRMAAIGNRLWAAAIGLVFVLLGVVAFLLPHYIGKGS